MTTGTVTESPSLEDEKDRVPCGVTYGLDLAQIRYSIDSPTLMMDVNVHDVPTGASQEETSQETIDIMATETHDAGDNGVTGDIPSTTS